MKHKIIYTIFILVIVATIAYGGVYVFKNINLFTSNFHTDGYVIYLDEKNKANVIPFYGGTSYSYKKYDNRISFDSNNNKVKVEDSSVVHYQDNNLLLFKNVVGIDLNNIDQDIVFYYNIFRNTEIEKNDNKFVIKSSADSKVDFEKMLLRITDDKFLLCGNAIRVIFATDEVVEFNDYVYFEYSSGSVIRIYNNDKYYQTIDATKISMDDILIDLKDKTIEKNNHKYISLSNLINDKDDSIDVIEEEANVEKLNIKKPNISDDILEGKNNSNTVGGNNNSGSVDVEETVDDKKVIQEPQFKVTSMNLTALKLDATIEINDPDGTLDDAVKISIVENATAKSVYEMSLDDGNLFAQISYPNLKPDTEYTLYAKGSYKIDDIVYDKSFVSKIFRTEALGVSIEKSYVTVNTAYINVIREHYSKVNSAVVGIYDLEGNQIDSKTLSFNSESKTEIFFDGLDHNKEYTVKLYDILSGGVIVDDGYSQKIKIKTLKMAPQIGELGYSVNKVDSTFQLDVSKVIDADYGIKGYRYEIFDARSDLLKDTPLLTINKDSLSTATIKVDDLKIHRGVAYTYRLITEFYDNEKTVEYIDNLGTVMQLDGVAFPTLRFEKTRVTWEQINGAIIIDDPSGTIMSDTYRIVYKNSIDYYKAETITVSTPKNSIPINVNYLRANETYTFDVYASINLQDGNTTADETYIGSVKVQTGMPKDLHANFSINNTNSDAFSLNFSLSSDGEDASFEASTLSSLTFTLYQGTTSNGKVEVYKKIVDTNGDEYQSTLKEDFFDRSKIIDAKFFNSENSDFKQKNYTLVVEQAYDYTEYETNKITITNNVFNFELQNYIPSLPNLDEPQILVNPILNKFAESFGLEYNNELEPNTLIAYSVTATYDNSNDNAKYVIYHVHRYNHLTEEYEKLANLDKRIDFNDDGSLSDTIFTLSNGTSLDTVDSDTLRRGNSYYFSFDVYIDINSDGVVDTIFPTSIDENAELKSEELNPNKQGVLFALYPSASNANTFTWKYKAKDVDYALFDNKLYGYINSNVGNGSYADIEVNKDNYQSATFIGLSAGNNITIAKREKLTKKSSLTLTNLTSQYFYGYISQINSSYTVTGGDNKVTIALSNTQNLGKVVYSEIEIVPTNATVFANLGKKVIHSDNIDDGKIIVDYNDIKEYISTDLQVNVTLYYDSGETGFDYNNNYALIQGASYENPGNYLYLSTNNRLLPTTSIYGKLTNIVFDSQLKNLIITNLSDVRNVINLNIDSTGVVYNDENIIMKNVKTETLSSTNKNFDFDFIIPGVSLTTDNKINITPLLTSVYVDAKIVDSGTSDIRDNIIYMEVYETDPNGNNGELVKTLANNISAFNSHVEITDLSAKTNYYLMMYVYLFNGSTLQYEKQYLYDIDQKQTGCKYRFHTLSDVCIKNISVDLESTSYQNKNLVIEYTLENVTGFSYIDYEIYKRTNDGYVMSDIHVPRSTVFYRRMNVNVLASPGHFNDLKYGETYKIIMRPVGEYTLDNESFSLDLGTTEYEFTINDYQEPYIGITSGKTDSSIYFRVSVNDISDVIVNDEYKIKLLDSEGNIIAEKEEILKFGINKKFEFDATTYHLTPGEEYKFIVVTAADYENDGQTFTPISKTKIYKYGASVDVGTVILTNNSTTPNAIDLVFSYSYNLNAITRISYSISSVNSGFYYSGTNSFITRYDETNDLYYFTIDINDENFNPQAVYIVSINFYERDTLIDSEEFNYYAGGNVDEP